MKKRISLLLATILTLSIAISSFTVAFAANSPVEASVYSGDYTLQDTYLEKFSDDKANGVKQYDIYNADAFWSLVSLISTTEDGFEGCTISLKCDLVYNTGNAEDWATQKPSLLWNTIGNDTVPFKGTFDGEGHTISGIYVEGKNIGLFGRVTGATIKNVGLLNSYINQTTAGGYPASIVSTMYTTPSSIIGCYSDAIINSTDYGAGGIVGLINTTGCKVSQCAFDGSISGGEKSSTAGGIVGVVGEGNKNGPYNDGIIEDCINLGSVHTGDKRSGGIVGQTYDNVSINRCFTVGSVTSAKTVSDSDNTKVYDGCAFFGTIAKNTKGTSSGVSVTNSYIFSDLNQKVHGVNEEKTGKYTDGFAGGITMLQSTAIKGNDAKTALTSLDFTSVWSAMDGDFPIPTATKTILDGVTNLADPNTPAVDNQNPPENTPDDDKDKETEADTEAQTEAQTTTETSAQTDDTNGGCGSFVGGAAVTLIIGTLGVCTVVCKKKK